MKDVGSIVGVGLLVTPDSVAGEGAEFSKTAVAAMAVWVGNTLSVEHAHRNRTVIDSDKTCFSMIYILAHNSFVGVVTFIRLFHFAPSR